MGFARAKDFWCKTTNSEKGAGGNYSGCPKDSQPEIFVKGKSYKVNERRFQNFIRVWRTKWIDDMKRNRDDVIYL